MINKRSGAAMAPTALAIAAVMLAAGAEAQQDDAMLIDVRNCVVLESELERFACYEAEVRKRWPESPRQQVGANSGLSAQPDAALREAPASTKGVRPTPETVEAEETQSFDSRISELKETVPGRHLITLENGQVWRQMRAEPRFRLRAGQQVSLSPTSWGKAWRMSIPALRGYLQVERLR